jgi:hypothetical protein
MATEGGRQEKVRKQAEVGEGRRKQKAEGGIKRQNEAEGGKQQKSEKGRRQDAFFM